jgi:hypothetical protein
MKIRPVGGESLHTGGRTDRHDGPSSRFNNFAWRTEKWLENG